MHIHQTDLSDPNFIGCEPTITKIKLKKQSNNSLEIVGKYSTKQIRCELCGTVCLVSSFNEVKK